jgi:hypothetical protein
MEFDPSSAFDPEAIVPEEPVAFDAASAFDPESIVEEEPEKNLKGRNTVPNIIQDTARLLLSPAVVGLNAIGSSIGAAAAGEDWVKGLTEGAQQEEFLGFGQSMETTPGKWIEDKLGAAITAVRESGEKAPELFTTEKGRDIMKQQPITAVLLPLYDSLSDKNKVVLEASMAATGAALPETVLTLLGGRAAKKYNQKRLEPKEGMTVDQALTEFDEMEAAKPKEQLVNQDELPFTNDIDGGPDAQFSELADPYPTKQDELDLSVRKPDPNQQDMFEPEANEALEAANVNPIPTDEGFTPREPVLRKQEYLDLAKRNSDETTKKVIDDVAEVPDYVLEPKLQGKSLEELSKILPEDEWKVEFSKAHPDKSKEAADFAFKRLQPEKKYLQDIDNPFTTWVDNGIGTLFGRAQNLGDNIHQAFVDLEYSLIKKPYDILSKADKTIDATQKKFSPEAKLVFERAILNKDIPRAKQMLIEAGLINEAKTFDETILKPIEDLGKEAVKVGLFAGMKDNYVLPQMVKDYEGLSKELGKDVKGRTLEEAMQAAELKAQANGRKLTDLERTTVANKFVQGYPKPDAYKAGYRKERVFDEIPDNLKPFYHNFADTYHNYINTITADIEIAKFFGKDLKKTDGALDMEKSIGAHTQRLVEEGKLSATKQKELQDLIRARFVGGRQSPGAFVQTYKNAVSATLLSGISSAAKNLLEAFPTALYSQPQMLNGLRATLTASMQGVLGKQKLHARDFGFIDHISQLELGRAQKQGGGWIQSTVNAMVNASDTAASKVLKTTGFSALDIASKTWGLNTHLIGAGYSLKTAAGRRLFAEDWKGRFGKEYPQLVKDLQNQEITPLTMRYAFSQLVKGQSVTKGNWSTAMLNNPNGRAFFTLKTFMINQMNLYRTEAYNKIKRGNTKQGLQMMAKLATAMYVAQATGNQIQNFILGRDDDAFEASAIPMTLLKSYAVSDRAAKELEAGHVGKAIGLTILPPMEHLDKPLEDLMKEIKGEENKRRYLDVIPGGREIRARFMGGSEEWNARNESEEAR